MDEKPARRANIYDVAERAGVSTATVTRFFNKGYIKKETHEKIRVAVRDLGYERSRSAVQLARNTPWRIAVLTPDSGYPEDSRLFLNGLEHARQALTPQGIELITVPWKWNGPGLFVETGGQGTLQDLFDEVPHGFLIPPADPFTHPLFLKSLPDDLVVATLEADIQIPQRRIFYASDDLAACRSAAKLMAGACPDGASVLAYHTEQSDSHIERRVRAFADELRMLNPALNLCMAPRVSGEPLEQYAGRIVGPGAPLHGVFVPNKDGDQVSQKLAPLLARRNRMVIGFDWNPANRRALEKGDMDYLIHQRIDLAVYRSLVKIADILKMSEPTGLHTFRIPLEILDRHTAVGAEERMRLLTD